MKTESLLVSSQQKDGRHDGLPNSRQDVALDSSHHSVIRIPLRIDTGPTYDVVAILDPATRAAQKYTQVIMVCVCHSVIDGSVH